MLKKYRPAASPAWIKGPSSLLNRREASEGRWSGEANKGQTGVMEGTEDLEEEGEPGDPVGMYWAGREEKGHHLSAMQGKYPGKGDSGKKCSNAVSI